MDERLDDFYHNIFDKYLTISMSDVFDKATCFDVVHDIRKYLDFCVRSECGPQICINERGKGGIL